MKRIDLENVLLIAGVYHDSALSAGVYVHVYVGVHVCICARVCATTDLCPL